MLSDLKKPCFNNLKDFWSTLATRKPAYVNEYPDAIQIYTGMGAAILNPIFLKETANQQSLSRLKSPYGFWHDSERNKQLSLADIPLQLMMEQVPVMFISLDRNFTLPKPDNIQIEVVKNNSDLSDWIKPVQAGWGMNANEAIRCQECMTSAPEKFIHFIAKKDKQIVGAASLYLHPEMAGLYYLTVIPECRNQGIGTALHYARLTMAKTRGYQYATLQASPMNAHLSESIGFVTCSEVNIYKCLKE